VSWTYPAIYPEAVSYIKLYRGNSADFGGAILHRPAVTGSFYYDKVDADIQYWYWIEIVSVNGTVSSLIGPASATAKPLIEDMIERLTAKIDAGLLATTLRAKLDEISMLNDNLLAEIASRENANISLADAIASAQAGNAEALTFIANEQASRVTADSAIAENISIVAATLGDDFAAVTTAMQVNIDATKGIVDALYTAKVTVNGLVGGFGLWNNGSVVEAGFDVDTFWIGRTSADKRKPFIIDGGVVYIDEAAINKLTFSKLRDESGSFVVAGGKVKANYIEIANAMITNAMIADAQITTAKIGDGQITNAKIGDAQITTAKIGDAQISTAKIGEAQIDTLRIGANQVTVPWAAQTAGSFFVNATAAVVQSLSITCYGGKVFLSGSINLADNVNAEVSIVRRGTGVSAASKGTSINWVDEPGAGNHIYDLWARLWLPGGADPGTTSSTYRNLMALESRR